MNSMHIYDATIVDHKGATHKDQAIVVENGHIKWIGYADDLQPTEGATTIDAGGGICLPGLINSHNHSPLMIVRGMVEDLGFAPAYTPGVPQGHWLSDEETYALSRLGVMEMMMAGATTIVDHYSGSEGLARSASELGVRGIVGGKIMDVDTASLTNGLYLYDKAMGEQSLLESLDLYDRWNGVDNGRINVILAPHAPDTCSRELMSHVVQCAAERGCQIHTYLAQSKREIEQVLIREGCSSVEYLDDVGALSENLVAAHCIFLTETEIEQLGSHKINVAHSPLGNARAGNIAPIMALEAAGANITLCTDTKSADMFECLRMAISVARMRAQGKFVLDAATVFDWATVNAAKCFKDCKSAKYLAVGEPADMIILDAKAPNLYPCQNAVGTAVHLATANNVRFVVCGGELLLDDGNPTRVDAQEVISTAQTVADRLWNRAGKKPTPLTATAF